MAEHLAAATGDGKELRDWLLGIWRDKTNSLEDRKWAFDRIADRMLGKPMAEVVVSGGMEVSTRPNLGALTLEELDRLEELTRKVIPLPASSVKVLKP